MTTRGVWGLGLQKNCVHLTVDDVELKKIKHHCYPNPGVDDLQKNRLKHVKVWEITSHSLAVLMSQPPGDNQTVVCMTGRRKPLLSKKKHCCPMFCGQMGPKSLCVLSLVTTKLHCSIRTSCKTWSWQYSNLGLFCCLRIMTICHQIVNSQ